MKKGQILASRFREVTLNGTWIANTNFKDQLDTIDWETARKKIEPLNSIVALTSHVNYYVAGLNNVFVGGSLEIKDKFSYEFMLIQSSEEWDKIRNKFYNDAEKFASHVEKMSDEKLNDFFVEEKYGSYQRNIDAMIEHCYYHLGQIVLIKKLIK